MQRLWEQEGYDTTTSLFYDGSAPSLAVPPAATRDDALRARDRLLDAFSEFRFADSRIGPSVVIAYVLTAIVRPLLPTAPLFLVTSTVRGSGKGTLISMVNAIAFGHDAATMPPLSGSDAENEARKRIFSVLAAGTVSVHIDNVVGKIGGPALCSMLTSREWSDRKLGESKTPTVPQRTLWAASGNNVVAEGDLVRRSVRIHLDPDVEHPEFRKFTRRDPLGYVMQHRGELLTAGFTMLSAYLRAGRPLPGDVVPLGSFVDWSELVRNCCIWLDLADPLESQTELRFLDPERAVIAPFYAAWFALFGSRAMTVAKAVLEIWPKPAPGGADFDSEAYATWQLDEAKRTALRDAVATVVDMRGNVNKALGEWLSQHQDRIVDGRAFRRSDDGDRAVARWALQPKVLEPVADSAQASGAMEVTEPGQEANSDPADSPARAPDLFGQTGLFGM